MALTFRSGTAARGLKAAGCGVLTALVLAGATACGSGVKSESGAKPVAAVAEDSFVLPSAGPLENCGDLHTGSRGACVRVLQSYLNDPHAHNQWDGAGLSVDGIYGSKTAAAVQAFQTYRSLPSTGVADAQTRSYLANGSPAACMDTLVGMGSATPCVVKLQNYLSQSGHPLTVDGIFGARTRDALKAFQKDMGQDPDGIAGPEFWGPLSGD
ncbi:peptidoglycan-binding protein [Streptomyces sp. NBC_01478]|uniref:peptidoglycan-binding domain-containing protein n=1 Tax=Streptomyces sp. NBC_01478 TaxID=2903882 RepID=UPI002E306D8D|nr:peptidoglycan-binding protein [Streptomyces sp. NBC_01478]